MKWSVLLAVMKVVPFKKVRGFEVFLLFGIRHDEKSVRPDVFLIVLAFRIGFLSSLNTTFPGQREIGHWAGKRSGFLRLSRAHDVASVDVWIGLQSPQSPQNHQLTIICCFCRNIPGLFHKPFVLESL